MTRQVRTGTTSPARTGEGVLGSPVFVTSLEFTGRGADVYQTHSDAVSVALPDEVAPAKTPARAGDDRLTDRPGPESQREEPAAALTASTEYIQRVRHRYAGRPADSAPDGWLLGLAGFDSLILT